MCKHPDEQESRRDLYASICNPKRIHKRLQKIQARGNRRLRSAVRAVHLQLLDVRSVRASAKASEMPC